jgi:hypothetical protein
VIVNKTRFCVSRKRQNHALQVIFAEKSVSTHSSLFGGLTYTLCNAPQSPETQGFGPYPFLIYYLFLTFFKRKKDRK